MRYIWICLIFVLTGNGVAQTKGPPSTPSEIEKEYQKRVQKDSIAGVYIPKDVPDAFRQLDKLIDAPSKAKFKAYPEEEVKVYGLKSLGKWITLNWSFYEGSRLAAKLKSMGIYHPDDMAQFLVIGYYRKLNNLPLEEDKRIKEYQVARKAAIDNRKSKGTVLSETKIKKPKPGK